MAPRRTQASDDGQPQSVAGILRRVARPASAGDLNDALVELLSAVEPWLCAAISRQLAQSRVGGPDGVLADADQLLNDVLWEVAQSAHAFRGQSDAEAEAWLRKMAHRKVLDATKTPWRRLRLLVERLRDFGYRVNANTRAEDDDRLSGDEED